jgi:hypothetical protein
MVIAVEAAAFRWGFRFLDALMAAWLLTFLLALAGVFFVLEETAASGAPVLTANEFLITVFIFEFVAGALLLYALYLTTQSAEPWWNSWLTGTGVILGVSGWLALLVRSGVAQVGDAALLSGFIVATLGLASGMMTMILLVRPDFDGDSIAVHLQETDVWQVVWGSETSTEEQEREVPTDSRHQ